MPAAVPAESAKTIIITALVHRSFCLKITFCSYLISAGVSRLRMHAYLIRLSSLEQRFSDA
jgi:hypothetical protein